MDINETGEVSVVSKSGECCVPDRNRNFKLGKILLEKITMKKMYDSYAGLENGLARIFPTGSNRSARFRTGACTSPLGQFEENFVHEVVTQDL